MQLACGQVEECGVKSLLIQGDVSQEQDIIDMVNTVVEQFGSLDILINNAGIQKECPSHEIPTLDFDNVLSVNLRGAFLCAREAIKHFLSQNRGIIINVSSVHEIIPRRSRRKSYSNGSRWNGRGNGKPSRFSLQMKPPTLQDKLYLLTED